MPAILFFEDYPYETENRLFRMNLRQQLKEYGVEILEEKTVPGFERSVRSGRPDILVLDIMAVSVEPLRRFDTGVAVPEDLTGVELLRRCRGGFYGDKFKMVPLYMRTARGEPEIRLYCEALGATGYFSVGVDDEKLIAAIRLSLSIQHASAANASPAQ
jgi:DNA-binding NarL/FixJ family response regulator